MNFVIVSSIWQIAVWFIYVSGKKKKKTMHEISFISQVNNNKLVKKKYIYIHMPQAFTLFETYYCNA